MSDVIDFKNKLKMESKPKDNELLLKMFQGLSTQVDHIKEVFIIVKDIEDDFTMFYSDLSIQEKSFIIQMLQHDIFQELESSSEIVYQPEN